MTARAGEEIAGHGTAGEQPRRESLVEVFRNCPIPEDELNRADFPGQTLALQEVFGLRAVRLQRSPLTPFPSFFVVK